MAKGYATPGFRWTWRDLSTRPLLQVPKCCRTLDGWVSDLRFWPGVWAGLPFATQVPSSPKFIGESLETARFGPPLPGIKRIERDTCVILNHLNLF